MAKALILPSRQNLFLRILQKFHLNTTRPTARFMTVPGYVDSDVMVWRRRWFDSISVEARAFNVGLYVVIVRDISMLNPATAPIYCLVTLRIHLQCRGKRKSLISCAQRPLRGRRVGWDELLLMRPKHGSRDGPAYFAILMFRSSLVKINFCPDVCCVVCGFCGFQTQVF